jgi:DNA-binding transcriptional MerR regulator
MQSANYQNQRRQQQISEEMQKRGFSLNEINAILTGQQVGMPNMPSFNTAQRSEGVQSLTAAGMQNQADLDAYSAQQGAQQSTLSGLAGGAMKFSDIRVKKNIYQMYSQRTDKLPIYIYDYLWEDDWTGRHVGVMAHEAEKLYPEAVSTHESGCKMVDYGRIPGWH